jgi:hypothetical protein
MAQDLKDHRIMRVGLGIQLPQPLTNGGAVFADKGLAHVILDMDGFGRRRRGAARGWDQAPADNSDENEAGCGNRGAHWGEVEHREWRALDVAAEAGDDYVRRRADEGDQAAQDGAEGDRHQNLGGGPLGPGRRRQGGRHQQRQCPHVVHDGG